MAYEINQRAHEKTAKNPRGAGRPAGGSNKLNKQDFDQRLSDLEAELAEIKLMLPKGMEAKDYIAGRDAAKFLKGDK